MTTTLTPRTYKLTRHAVERTIKRLGVPENHAHNHVNQLMQSAYMQGIVPSKYGPARVYDHHKTNTRIIVSEDGSTVITVYKHEERSVLDVVKADFLRPTLERELRKVKRESTRQIRAAERSLAKVYAELAERMKNFANARNPHTRDLIQERIWEAEEAIDEIKRNIERMMGEYETKVEAIEVIRG